MSPVPALLVLLACAPDDALPLGSAAEDCAACHVEQAAAWAVSGHATSGTSPVYTALRPRVEAAWGERSAQACDGCHQPGWGGDEGIGCVSCHAAVGDHGARDGRLAVELGAPLAGPLGPDSIATPAHTSAVRGYLRQPELCGACHEVTGPRLFVESTLTEAAGDGRSCVECHAERIDDGGWTPSTPSRERHDHRYAALSPPWAALGAADAPDDADLDAFVERSVALLAAGLELRVEGDEVVLTNAGAGHAIPTGVSFLRSIRVEVEQDGVLVDIPIELGADPLRAGWRVPLITDADAVRSNALAPGESRRARLPEGGGVVHLRARAIREDVEAALGLDTGAPLVTVESLPFGAG